MTKPSKLRRVIKDSGRCFKPELSPFASLTLLIKSQFFPLCRNVALLTDVAMESYYHMETKALIENDWAWWYLDAEDEKDTKQQNGKSKM